MASHCWHKLLLMSKSKSSERLTARANLESWHLFRLALIEQREKSGMTQQAVANKLGITQSAVSQFESFGGNPRLMTVMAYALAIGAKLNFSIED